MKLSAVIYHLLTTYFSIDIITANSVEEGYASLEGGNNDFRTAMFNGGQALNSKTVDQLASRLDKRREMSVSRRKRHVTLSDTDLDALVSFLRDIKRQIENLPETCGFTSEDEVQPFTKPLRSAQPEDPDADYPSWMIPHSQAVEPLPAPQRRSSPFFRHRRDKKYRVLDGQGAQLRADN